MNFSPGQLAQVDHRLHDHLVGLVSASGPQSLDWLARKARRDLRDARIDAQAVIDVVEVSTLLVPQPSGEIDYALRLLEGNVLTHRVRAPLRGRTDLGSAPGCSHCSTSPPSRHYS